MCQALRSPAHSSARAQAYGGDELLRDLQKLFNASWKHPAADLRPDIARVVESWKVRQMDAKGIAAGSDGAETLQQLATSLQEVGCRKVGSGVYGAVLGSSDFAKLRPDIEDAWRSQLSRDGSAGPTSSPPPSQPSVAQAGCLQSNSRCK